MKKILFLWIFSLASVSAYAANTNVYKCKVQSAQLNADNGEAVIKMSNCKFTNDDNFSSLSLQDQSDVFVFTTKQGEVHGFSVETNH